MWWKQHNNVYIILIFVNVVNVHMCEKKKSFTSWLCDVPVDDNEKAVFQYFAVLLYHFSGSKTPWLMNKLYLLRFSISFPIVSFV